MDKEALFKKLRLHKAKKILIINAPQQFILLVKGLSYDSKPLKKNEGTYDFVQVFASKQKEMVELAKMVEKMGISDCLFWLCYPKGTGKIKSDIKRETVWIAFEGIGLQAVTQIAIDETWSALRGRPLDKVGK